MKNIFFLLLLMISCKSFPQANCQIITTVPLRTYGISNKECYYFEDTNNELQSFEGTWKGVWNGKTVFITFKKVSNNYNDAINFNADIIIGKFKTLDSNGNILFDNTQSSDEDARIEGTGFQKSTDKYLMFYYDKDLCRMTGDIEITFANTAKTQLNFFYHQDNKLLDTDCYFYNYDPSQYPEPLPKINIILTKQ